MKAPSPIDKDSISVNFLTQLERVMRRLDALERQAASGLFANDSDTMLPPGDMNIEKGNVNHLAGRAIFNSIVGFGDGVPLTPTDNGGGLGEITITKSWHIVADPGGALELAIINGGVDGDLLWIQAASGDTLPIDDGGGNIHTAGAGSINDQDFIHCIFNGTDWCCDVVNIAP